ncbi:MAG: hypothetical protein NEHIOOID_00254 [Holosporales bacterium]
MVYGVGSQKNVVKRAFSFSVQCAALVSLFSMHGYGTTYLRTVTITEKTGTTDTDISNINAQDSVFTYYHNADHTVNFTIEKFRVYKKTVSSTFTPDDAYTTDSIKYFLMFPFTSSGISFSTTYTLTNPTNHTGTADITPPVDWVVNFGNLGTAVTNYFFNGATNTTITGLLDGFKASASPALADGAPFYVWRVASSYYFKVYYNSTDGTFSIPGGGGGGGGGGGTGTGTGTSHNLALATSAANPNTEGDYNAWDGFSGATSYTYPEYSGSTLAVGSSQALSPDSVFFDVALTATLSGGVITIGDGLTPLLTINGMNTGTHDLVSNYFYDKSSNDPAKNLLIKKQLLTMFKEKRNSSDTFWGKTLYVWRPGSDSYFAIHFDFSKGDFVFGDWSTPPAEPAFVEFDTAIGVPNPTSDSTIAFRELLSAPYEWHMTTPVLYRGSNTPVNRLVGLDGTSTAGIIFKNAIPTRSGTSYTLPAGTPISTIASGDYATILTYILDGGTEFPAGLVNAKTDLVPAMNDIFYLWRARSGYYVPFFFNGSTFVLSQDVTVSLYLYPKSNAGFVDSNTENVNLTYQTVKDTPSSLVIKTKGLTSEKNFDALEAALSAILSDPNRTLLRGTLLQLIAKTLTDNTKDVATADPVAAAISTALTLKSTNAVKNAVTTTVRTDIAKTLTDNTKDGSTDDTVAVAISTALTASAATANGVKTAVTTTVRADIATTLTTNTGDNDPVATAISTALTASSATPQTTNAVKTAVCSSVAAKLTTNTGDTDTVAAAISRALTATASTANGVKTAVASSVAAKLTTNTGDTDTVAAAISAALTANSATPNGVKTAVQNSISVPSCYYPGLDPIKSAVRTDIATTLTTNTGANDTVAAAISAALNGTSVANGVKTAVASSVAAKLTDNTKNADNTNDPVAAAISKALTDNSATPNGVKTAVAGVATVASSLSETTMATIKSAVRTDIAAKLTTNTGGADTVAAAISTALTGSTVNAGALQSVVRAEAVKAKVDDATVASILSSGPHSQLAVRSIICKGFDVSDSNNVKTVITAAVQAAIKGAMTSTTPTVDETAFKNAIINSIASAIAGSASTDIQAALVARLQTELTTGGRLYTTVHGLYQTSLETAQNAMLERVATDITATPSTLVPKISDAIQNSTILQGSIKKVISDAIRITNDVATDLNTVLQNKIAQTYPSATITDAVVADINRGRNGTSSVLNALAVSIADNVNQGTVSSTTLRDAIQRLN